MVPLVKKVNPCDNYILHLEYDNGEVNAFDMKPLLDIKIFQKLRDVNHFRNVKISFDTIEWENEIDIDPDTLYAESVSL